MGILQKLSKWNFLLFVAIIQLLVTVIVVLNIPIVREVVGFLDLTFIPGFALVRLLKLDKSSVSKTIFFSVILSITFLMIIGFLINELYIFGVSTPLDLWILVSSVNIAVLVLAALDSLFNKKGFDFGQGLKVHPVALCLFALPVLSAVGALLTNASQGNAIPLFSIAAISTAVIFVALYNKMPELRPMILLLTSMSMLLSGWLLTKYIYGYDEWTEFYVFRLTLSNLHWNLSLNTPWDTQLMKFNAMASISILPTIYAEVLGLGSNWIFKIVFPVILSFMALGLYELYKTQTNVRIAFLASFFYLAGTADLNGPMRQMVAQLFFISLFIVILEKSAWSSQKRALFIILDFALVLSHYSIALVFLVAIFFVWIVDLLWSQSRFRDSSARPRKIPTSLMIFSFVMTFSWYIYISSSGAFNGIVGPIENIIQNFSGDFFNLGSRGGALEAVGIIQVPSILNHIGNYVFYLTEFLMAVGFIAIILKRKQLRFDMEYLVIITFFMGLLASNILVPNLASAFTPERFYQMSLILLAPLCIIGIEEIARTVLRFKNEIKVLLLALVILVPFFLFRTGFVYEIGKVQTSSLELSMYRVNSLTVYGQITNTQDVFGTLWFSQYANVENGTVYADIVLIGHVLAAYGLISQKNAIVLSSTTSITDNNSQAYVFLGQFNVNDGILVDAQGNAWNTSQISGVLNGQNAVYSNGGCEIYSLTP